MSGPDISQLNSAQQEALQTYTSVTDQDPIAAISLLQRSEWNVQIAIARFFDGEPATDPLADAQSALPSTSARQTSNLQYESLLAANRPSISNRSLEDRVERIDSSSAAETQHSPPLLLSLLLTPFNIMYRVLTAVLSPFNFLVPAFISRLLARLLTQRSRPTRRALPPADNAQRFIREFSEEYGDNNLPFTESGFNLTLENARKDLKFLLVVLLAPNHEENNTWVQNTLLSSQLKTFLNSHRNEVMLWGGNVQDSETYQVSSSLKCTKFPFAALICHTSDIGSPGMTVIMRAVGSLSGSELVAKLGTAMTAQNAQLRAARTQQSEQQASRSLRQEQDSAYERSLAQDRERSRRKREEQEAKAKAEKEAIAKAEAQELRKHQTTQWRRWRVQSLPSEPGAEAKDVVRVSIRMLSGDRIIRKFRSEADLEELYAFVECYDILNDQGPTSSLEEKANVEEPKGYDHEYGFRLVSPLPRAVFDLAKGGTIGEKIGRSGNLIVESTTHEAEDSDLES